MDRLRTPPLEPVLPPRRGRDQASPSSSAQLLYALRGALIGPLRRVTRFWNPQRALYIPPDLSLRDFAASLHDRKVSYVALGLDWSAHRGLELLVQDDSDFEQLEDLLSEWPIGTPLTVYTVSPRHRTAYYSPLVERSSANRIAVFPPYISEQLLERSVEGPNGLKTLTDRDAFFACAYRAAYMEAVCCDWQDEYARCATCSRHEAEVRRRAANAGIPLAGPLTVQSVDHLLHANGWRPPLDLLERASRWAPWIQSAFPEMHCADEDDKIPGLAIFFLRERALQNGWKQQVLAVLAESGFDLLLVQDLDPETRKRASRLFRGGDWGTVNLRVSGGIPACIVVGLDLHPRPVSEKDRERQPDADNDRTIVAKEAARKLVKANLPLNEAFNPLHSTDSSRQAWTAIQLLLPDRVEEVRAKVRERRSSRSPPGQTNSQLLSYRHSTTAEILDFNGTKAVRKTFPPGELQLMRREIEVITQLGPLCPELPRLLEFGPDFIVVECVEPCRAIPKPPRPLPLWAIRQLSAIIRTCVAHGFDPIGLTPSENVVLSKAGIRVADTTSWQRCDPDLSPERCGALNGGAGDEAPARADYWDTRWRQGTALSKRSFLYDPPWRQRIEQAIDLGPRYAGWITRELRRRILPQLARRLGRRLLPRRARVIVRTLRG